MVYYVAHFATIPFINLYMNDVLQIETFLFLSFSSSLCFKRKYCQINCSKTMLKSVAMWDQAKRWMGEKRELEDGNRIVTIIKDNYDALKSLWWYLHCKRSYMVRSAQRSAELYVVIFIDFCAYFHWDFEINNRANRKRTIRRWKKV